MGVRRIVSEVKASFASGGIAAVAETHAAGRRKSLTYRLLSGLLDFAYPAAALLEIMKDVDRQVGELGIVDGSKAVLARLPGSRETAFPPAGEDEIRTRPAVVFGKHGSVLTPFLVAASLERPDLKMLAASYIAKLGPNVAATMYSVHLPPPTLRTASRRGILLRLGAWLTARIEADVEKDAARQANRASLIQAGEHVRGGGALLIAPDARDSKARWRTGIGLLIAHLAGRRADGDEIYLVPYRTWAPIAGVFHLFSPNPLLRAFGKWEYRRPMRVVFAEPLALSVVVARTGTDPTAITEYLEAHYRGLGF